MDLRGRSAGGNLAILSILGHPIGASISSIAESWEERVGLPGAVLQLQVGDRSQPRKVVNAQVLADRRITSC